MQQILPNDSLAAKILKPALATGERTLSICFVCPRFEPSFFGMEYALPLLPGDKRSASFPGALPLLAALTPGDHSVTILDENIEPLDFNLLRSFDVVALTGMIVQRKRMDEILQGLAGSDAVICVGGPYVTVEESFFEGKCDVMFVGEADQTWPQFVNDLAAGEPILCRIEQAAPTDMTALPPPRFDLLKTGRYMTATMQFSRGCPFLCEFCDIIVIFGRKPRLKLPSQIVAELDALLALGVRSVFFVDDNFIGNKNSAKRLLEVLVEWQERNGYAMHFSTEASVNLGDDPEAIDLLWRANFGLVFIGIETPRTESLVETRKLQNVRGDSVEAKIARIQDAGIIVQAGFIVGFDHDDESIFEEQFNFLQRTGIVVPFISVLSPIPSTPLYDRLRNEGRLQPRNELIWYEPKLMSRETLRSGYLDLTARIYSAEAFFERVFGRQFRSLAFRERRRQARARAGIGSLRRLRRGVGALTMAARLMLQLISQKELMRTGRAYLRNWRESNRPLGADGLTFTEYLGLCARHWHCFRVAQETRSNWGQ